LPHALKIFLAHDFFAQQFHNHALLNLKSLIPHHDQSRASYLKILYFEYLMELKPWQSPHNIYLRNTPNDKRIFSFLVVPSIARICRRPNPLIDTISNKSKTKSALCISIQLSLTLLDSMSCFER